MTPGFFKYDTCIYEVNVGDLSLKIEALVDFEKTVDQFFSASNGVAGVDLLPEHCPYFAALWPSARALSDYLSQMALHDFMGKEVLELGCGLALPSFVIAARGGKVTASDCHKDVPFFLARNISLNHSIGMTYLELDWRISQPEGCGKFDLILGSDVLYDSDQPMRLIEQLKGLSKPGTRVLIADPGRAYLQEFNDLLTKSGIRFSTTVVSTPQFGSHKAIEVFIFDALFD